MNQDLPAEKSFLNALYQATNGDPSEQASMYDIGTAIGIDNEQAGELAQDLCIKGFAELKTLSGGVGITALGLKELDISVTPDMDPVAFSLGDDVCLDQEKIDMVVQAIDDIKTTLADSKNTYPAIEEMVIDIKTAEVQLLSPKPKTAVIKALLKALLASIEDQASSELVQKLEAMVS